MTDSVGYSAVQLYMTYAANEAKYATASVKSDPKSNALIAYFQKNAAKITSPDALLKDYKALSLVLGAFGLQGSINNTAILRKLMTQDPTSKTSLAQTIGNTKYRLFAQALSDWSTPPFSTSASQSQIIASFTTNTFEAAANKQAPGLANALYFAREASSLKTTAAVQSDSNLLAVAVTSSGLPLQSFESLDFAQQTKILTEKLNIATLQNPAVVRRMAEQYLVAQQSNASDQPAYDSVSSLFSDGVADIGDTLLAISSSSGDASSDSGSGVLSLFA